MAIKVTLDAPSVIALFDRNDKAMVEVEKKVIEQATESINRRLTQQTVDSRVQKAIECAIGGTNYRGEPVASDALRKKVKEIVTKDLTDVLRAELRQVATDVVKTLVHEQLVTALASAKAQVIAEAKATALQALTAHLKTLGA